MVKYLTETLEEEQYYCKALPNETVKINVNTSDSYRRLIKRLQDDKIAHHTYQVREERAYRVVLRNLHHSFAPNEIQAELETLGHKVRNVLNICHRVTREPLPLDSVDLEPHDNNKTIYDLKFLCNMKIIVEAPRKKKIISFSALGANFMGTPKATAPDRMSALSVGTNTIRPCAQKTQQPHLRVPYVAENTQRVAKDTLYTKSYSKHGVKPITQYTKPLFGLLLLQSTSTMPVNSTLYLATCTPFQRPNPHLLHIPVLSHTTSSRSTRHNSCPSS